MSRLLLVVCLVACLAGVVSAQCTYDSGRRPSPGRILEPRIDTRTPVGGAKGVGGATLRNGFCIPPSDNTRRCQGYAAVPLGLYECAEGELCCENTFLQSDYKPPRKNPPGVCFLSERDPKTGQFIQGKCAGDKWGECDQVSRTGPLGPTDDCPGKTQCCEFLKGEFDQMNNKLIAAANARRAAEKAAAEKAKADAAAAIAARNAAVEKAAAEENAAALRAAEARPAKPIVECQFVENSLIRGSCVYHEAECPGVAGQSRPVTFDYGSRTISRKCADLGFGEKGGCCRNGSRLPGKEEADRAAASEATRAAQAADAKAQIDAAANKKKNGRNAVWKQAEAAFAASGKNPLPCVAFEGRDFTKREGFCAPTADFCEGPNALTFDRFSTQDNACRVMGVQGLEPVCCAGGGKVVRTDASTDSAAAPAADAAKPTLSLQAAQAALAGKTACRFRSTYGDQVGYCSPQSFLCPDATKVGIAQNIIGFANNCGKLAKAPGQPIVQAVCCGLPTQPAADVANTVCPLPAFGAFLELEESHSAAAEMSFSMEGEDEEPALVELEAQASALTASPIGRVQRRLARAQAAVRSAGQPKKSSKAKKSSKSAAKTPKTQAKDAKKGGAGGFVPRKTKESSAAAKLTPAQKKHCEAERRNWLAAKARNGDVKAIAELQRLAPKNTKTNAKKTAAKKAAPKKASGKASKALNP